MSEGPTRMSIGAGAFNRSDLGQCGVGVVIEDGVRIFHPEHVYLGDHVYLGHDAFVHGYHRGNIEIGDDTWVGPQAYLHGAAGLRIGSSVGIGPGVRIITSQHQDEGRDRPILWSSLTFEPVTVEDDADIGVGAVLLPGITVGKGCIVGAGAVVTRSLPAYTVCAGNPARVLRERNP